MITTQRKRIWFAPTPGVYGMRAVAIKRRFGWKVIYRDWLNGRDHCVSHWTPFIRGNEYIDRDAEGKATTTMMHGTLTSAPDSFKHLIGKTALLRPTGTGFLYAQFDDRSVAEGFGWHGPFELHEFDIDSPTTASVVRNVIFD